jgi:hypothetical protein
MTAVMTPAMALTLVLCVNCKKTPNGTTIDAGSPESGPELDVGERPESGLETPAESGDPLDLGISTDLGTSADGNSSEKTADGGSMYPDTPVGRCRACAESSATQCQCDEKCIECSLGIVPCSAAGFHDPFTLAAACNCLQRNCRDSCPVMCM